MKFVANLDGTSVSKGVNFLDGVLSQDVATVHNLHAGAVKAPVRARVATNVTIAAPGATLDGLAAVLDDRFLLDGQTLGQEKGVYLFKGAAVPMVRALDCDESTELAGAFVRVIAGTSAGLEYRQTVAVVVVGTTPLVFSPWGAAAVAFGQDVGDAVASSFVLTHNFGSRNLSVEVVENATPFSRVIPDFNFTTSNTLTVVFASPPTALQYRVTVKPL